MQKKGVPTGGSLCVQLANIAVFYVLNKCVYSNPELMTNVRSIKRFIDDGAGIFVGTERQYENWIINVNRLLEKYNLNIDEFKISKGHNYVSFLDIMFCFDDEGNLQTDLFVKETDSRSYLNFNSCHPNHIFSGIVYSQFLRLRRIVNNNTRLSNRINEMKDSFRDAGYPNNLLENISLKVLSLERKLTNENNIADNLLTDKVLVVSTYSADSTLVDTAKCYEQQFLKTNCLSKPDNKLFQFVKKVGPNLKCRLVKSKYLALGDKFGTSKPCNTVNCQCCKLIEDTTSFPVNNRVVKVAPGDCNTYNIIYLLKCKLCQDAYIGRSTRTLRTRTGEHRVAFYKILNGLEIFDSVDNDDFSPGLHIFHKHGCKDRIDFDKTFNAYIIDNCSPKNMEVLEHKYIHRFKTLRPNGINTSSPFSIPVL